MHSRVGHKYIFLSISVKIFPENFFRFHENMTEFLVYNLPNVYEMFVTNLFSFQPYCSVCTTGMPRHQKINKRNPHTDIHTFTLTLTHTHQHKDNALIELQVKRKRLPSSFSSPSLFIVLLFSSFLAFHHSSSSNSLPLTSLSFFPFSHSPPFLLFPLPS